MDIEAALVALIATLNEEIAEGSDAAVNREEKLYVSGINMGKRVVVDAIEELLAQPRAALPTRDSMTDDLIAFTICIKPGVAEWLIQEAEADSEGRMRPETLAALMVEMAVDDKKLARAHQPEQSDPA